MAATGKIRTWKDFINQNAVVPVPFDRHNQLSDRSTPFTVTIRDVQGLMPKVGELQEPVT